MTTNWQCALFRTPLPGARRARGWSGFDPDRDQTGAALPSSLPVWRSDTAGIGQTGFTRRPGLVKLPSHKVDPGQAVQNTGYLSLGLVVVQLA